jgi:hypothetical protein
MATGIRSNGYTEYPYNPANSSGKKLKSVFYEKTIATGAGTNTLHILSGPHGFDDKINAVIGATPALTSANDNDLGFYKLEADGTFTAIDADILWDGVDLSSALTYRELLGTLNTSLDRDDNIGKLLSLSSESEPVGGVYLGLLIKTASTAASEVLKLEVKIEEATTK